MGLHAVLQQVYFTWGERDRTQQMAACMKDHNASYCECIDDKIFKEYTLTDFRKLDQSGDKGYFEFTAEMNEECSG